MKTILKKLLPVLAALAVFYALSLIYFSPALEGKRLVQGDLKNWQGMAQEIIEHREATGADPLWTGSMFSGMPAYQITVLWPQNLLRFADDAFHGFLPRPMSFLFLYLLGMYILLRCLRVDPWLSIVGAIAFGFSSYFFVILEAGHNSKANAIGYAPMVLGALHVLLRGNRLLGAALLALFLGLEVMMNHVQITYYLGFVLALYAAAEAVRALREKQLVDLLKRGALGIGAVVLALACNLGMLRTTAEYGAYTTRGKSELTIQPDGSPAAANQTSGLDRDYVTGWSYGKQESFSLLVPNAKGGASASMIQSQEDFRNLKPPAFRNAVMKEYQDGSYINAYWGDQSFTSGPVYVGAIALLLLLLMAVNREGRESWWMLAGAMLMLALIAIDNAAARADSLEPAVFMGMKASLVMGILVIAWLAFGLWAMRDALVYALFAALVLALLLSWGRNLMPLTDFFLDHVPGYSKFRAVTIILVIVELAVPALGILWLDRMLRDGAWDKLKERRFLLAAGTLAAIVLVIAIVPNLFNLLSDAEQAKFNARIADGAPETEVLALVEGLKDHRAGVLSADAWRTLGFLVAGAALVWLMGRRKLSASLGIGALGILILADQWSVDKRYVNNAKDKGKYLSWEDERSHLMPHKPNAADLAILQQEWNPKAEQLVQEQLGRLRQQRSSARGRDKMVTKEEEQLARFAALRRATDHRVLWLGDPFNDSRVSYFHKSVGGYHGAKLERYQELIEFHLRPAIMRISGQFGPGATMERLDSALAREGVLNMLNARYLIYSNDRPPLLNTNALGSAWFVDSLRWVKDADEEIMALGAIDPARTAIADERFRPELGDAPISPDPSASVTLDRYATDRLEYTVRSEGGGVVVFSAIWYGPDWQAYVDDQPASHARVNYVLRGMRVPAGEHKVVFQVEGRTAASSRPVMLGASLLVLLLALGIIGLEARKLLQA